MLRCVYENKEYIHYKKGRVQLQINVFGSFLQISHKVSNSVCGDSSIYPVIYAHTSCFLTTKKHQALFFSKLYLKNQRNHTLPLSSTAI